MKKYFLLLFFMWLITATHAVNVILNPYFQSHMVLQRDEPIVVWGESDPNVEFPVFLGDEKKIVKSDDNGKWTVKFKERRTSFSPLTLRAGDIVLQDILIGDVWICSGQSNMVFPVKNGDADTKNLSVFEKEMSKIRILSYSGLRLVAKNGYNESELARCNKNDFFSLKWNKATIDNLQGFSAVATHFGINLVSRIEIPIGLVQCAIGGSAINNWIPEEVLRKEKVSADWFSTDWLKNENIAAAHRKRGREALNKVLPSSGEYVIDEMKYHFLCEPSFLFESSFAKISEINVKGVLWYQGEADSETKDAIDKYPEFYNMLVNSWRMNFDNDKLPFISIQLPSYKLPLWPEMRKVQFNGAKENDYCYIVPIMDLGANNDIHYKGKKEVGKRAAYIALNNVYDIKVCDFPVYNDYRIKDNQLTLSFKNISKGLYISKNKHSVQVSVSYKNGVSEEVEAYLNSKNELVVPLKHEIMTLHYAWKPSLLQSALLYNDDKFPVSPFEIKF